MGAFTVYDKDYTVSNNLEAEMFFQCYLYQLAEMSAVQRKKDSNIERILFGHLFL